MESVSVDSDNKASLKTIWADKCSVNFDLHKFNLTKFNLI